MKHFFLFLAAVFLFLFVAHINKNQNFLASEQKPTIRVFAYSSFTSKWGPGPQLKQLFEQNCECIIEFIEGSDSGILLQRLKIEGQKLGADLVIGFDQFDLQKATVELSWRALDFSAIEIDSQIRLASKNEYFVPYDWGVLSFVARKSKGISSTMSLDDLLKSQFASKIALQDPRTSSVGLQFVMWVLKVKGEEEGFEYLKQMMKQAHSFSPSWSTAYGLFKSDQVDLVLSYTASPLYHSIEEKNDDYMSLEMIEPQPVQVEFVGIPAFCKNCNKAEEFINLIMSPEGQKIIMEKNYMLPVIKSVKSGTPFETIKVPFRLLDIEFPSLTKVDSVLDRWSQIRREISF